MYEDRNEFNSEDPIIFNTDESRLFYSKRKNRTFHWKGSKRVVVNSLGGGNDKLALTLVLGVTSKGELYPPIVILKGKTFTPKALPKCPKNSATEEEIE